MKVADQTVAARQLVVDQVTALYESKLKSSLDVSFANVNLSDARLLQAQAQSDVKAAEAELAAAMGLPAQNGFILSDEPMPPLLPDRVDDLIRQALQDRPDLKDARLRESADERFAKAEHALYYPSVGLIGTAGFVPSGSSTVPGRYGAVGVNVTVPLFNGGLFKARQTEAELKAKAASQLVSPGETILLDAGTTVGAMGEFLRDVDDLVVVTAGLTALEALADADDVRVECIGAHCATSARGSAGWTMLPRCAV